KFFYEEYSIDGLRFDEMSVMDRFGRLGGLPGPDGATWNDSVRDTVRSAIASASNGTTAQVAMHAIADAIAGVALRSLRRLAAVCKAAAGQIGAGDQRARSQSAPLVKGMPPTVRPSGESEVMTIKANEINVDRP